MLLRGSDHPDHVQKRKAPLRSSTDGQWADSRRTPGVGCDLCSRVRLLKFLTRLRATFTPGRTVVTDVMTEHGTRSRMMLLTRSEGNRYDASNDGSSERSECELGAPVCGVGLSLDDLSSSSCDGTPGRCHCGRGRGSRRAHVESRSTARGTCVEIVSRTERVWHYQREKKSKIG